MAKKEKQLHFYMSDELWDLLATHAVKIGISASALARMIIQSHLEGIQRNSKKKKKVIA